MVSVLKAVVVGFKETSVMVAEWNQNRSVGSCGEKQEVFK